MFTGIGLGGSFPFWELFLFPSFCLLGNVGPLWPGLLISQENPEFGILK